MEHACKQYTPEMISRFVDKELSSEQTENLTQHLEKCSDCNNLVKHYKMLSSELNSYADNYADNKILQAGSEKIKQKLEKTMQNSGKTSLENIFGLFGKNLYLKLASFAVILMIGVFSFQGNLLTHSDPSAIVKYVDTDFASVMIIETQKKQHTIIWFSET